MVARMHSGERPGCEWEQEGEARVPKACGILASQLGIEPWPLAVKPLGPDHWIAREFPHEVYLFIYNS